MNQPFWNNFQVSTQDSLSAVFSAFPVEGSCGITNWLLNQVPADAKALNNLLAQLQLTLSDPVKYPYLTTVRDWITTFQKTPDWNQLQPLSQTIFGMFANMFPSV